jgi:hypothetical protein
VNRCKTCVFWDVNEDDSFMRGMGRCSNALVVDAPIHTPPADGLVVVCDGPSHIWTGPEFGCVHHEVPSILSATPEEPT